MAPGLIMTQGGDSPQDQFSSGLPSPAIPQQRSEDNAMHNEEPQQLTEGANNGEISQLNGNYHDDAPQTNGHDSSGDVPAPNGVNSQVPHLTGINDHLTNGINGNGQHSWAPSIATPASEDSNPLNGFKTPLPSGEANPNAGMPIAIIGISVRAGSAATPDEFFEMLSRGRSAFSPEIPTERFNNASFYHPNAGKLGCINTNGASFIHQDVTKFDAPFFSITELEATSMDPQQRLLLECAFEALDNAGIQKHATVGKDIGVFMGAASQEYEFDLFRDSDTMPMFQATGGLYTWLYTDISDIG
jgi:hypothetical protein